MTARARLAAAMPSLKERAKTLEALDQGAEFLYTDGIRDLDAAAAKLLTPEARALLTRTLPALDASDWSGRRAGSRGAQLRRAAMASSWAMSPNPCAPP